MLHRFISLFLIIVIGVQSVAAATDPLQNPFATLLPGERVGEGQVVATDGTMLTVQAGDGEYRGAEVFRYRDGGSVAAGHEFAVGNRVRFVGTSEGRLVAVQNFDLLLADQFVSGIVREVTETSFTLTSTDGSRVIVYAGATTQFQTDAVPPVIQLGHTLATGTAVRVHGVRNVTTGAWFARSLGTYVTLLPEGSLDDELAAAESQLAETGGFRDTATSPYAPAIAFVKSRGIVGGYTDGTYRPDATINRAEFAKILMGARTPPTPPSQGGDQQCFPDVPSDAWFASYVCTAKGQAIIAGYPDGSFGPDQTINLAEGAKILVGAFGLEVAEPADGEAWFVPYLTILHEKNILPGELTDPSAALTRGQMAELIRRAMDA